MTKRGLNRSLRKLMAAALAWSSVYFLGVGLYANAFKTYEQAVCYEYLKCSPNMAFTMFVVFFAVALFIRPSWENYKINP